MIESVVSVVIVKNKFGYVATLRFTDPLKDQFISEYDKDKLYEKINDIIVGK